MSKLRLESFFVADRIRSDADFLLGLTLQILVGTKGKGATKEEDGVETDAGGCAVSGSGGGRGLRVALGLGVALLYLH